MADEEKLKTIQFIEKDERYELWFMDEFIAPGNNCGDGYTVRLSVKQFKEEFSD